MSGRHVAVELGQLSILNLRGLLVALRSGKTVPPLEIEVTLSRAVLDLAGLSDYAAALEKRLEESNGQDSSVQPMG